MDISGGTRALIPIPRRAPKIMHGRQNDSKNHGDKLSRHILTEGPFDTTCYPTGESFSVCLA
jgi:hypothetical protein